MINNILITNLPWMIWNSFLALVPLFLGRFLKRKLFWTSKLFILFLWLIFLPNTIYLITDMAHLQEQWPEVELWYERILLLSQYALLLAVGVITYILSLEYAFEGTKFYNLKLKNKYWFYFLAIIINFAVAFGVMMGRIERTNSWYVFTDPLRVLMDIINVFKNELILVNIGIFGIGCNFLFFATMYFFNDKYE